MKPEMNWDEMYSTVPLKKIPWHSDKPPNSLMEAIRKIKRGPVLDVCCGAGTNSIFLSKLGFKVRGVDVSETAIRIARKRAEKEGAMVDFTVGDIMDLKGKNQFDFILDRGCFHHISKKRRLKFVNIIHGLLNKNGKYLLMAFSDRNGFEKSLSKNDIRRFFSRHFRIGRMREEIHREPDNNEVYLYTILMEKK